MLHHQRGRLLLPPIRRPDRQVVNANVATASLSPANEASADAIRAGWAPLLTGQKVPRIGERF